MEEIWKDIEEYEGLYKVSNLGRVRSLNYRHTGKEHILAQHYNKKGYLGTGLSKNGTQKQYLIHRLVAETFIPNDDPEHKTQVNHKSEIKTQNTVWVNEDGSIDPEKSNLEWVTCEKNNNWGTRNKRISKTMINGLLSKPVKQMSLDGTLIAIWPSLSEAARNGFSHQNISSCCNGKRNSHKGFLWEFEN